MAGQAKCLTDDIVASVVQRESSTILTIHEAEFVDSEKGVVIPAKSFSLTNKKGLIALRDLLNKIDLS
ncbi:hypothetical protein D3C74_159900 [compost metagenome]